MDLITTVAALLKLSPARVAGAIALLDAGNTIPFIARYRKEATGSLDEVDIAAIRDTLEAQREIGRRRESIVTALTNSGQFTEQLGQALASAATLATLEDIYLPYRPKRRTRAAIAREAGLEPLADALYTRPSTPFSLPAFLETLATGIDGEQALAGARDIIAETVSEHPPSRELLRTLFRQEALIHSTVIAKKRDEAQKYRDYFDWREPVNRLAGHRLLAMLRGESEQLLRLTIRPDPQRALAILHRLHVTGKTGNGAEVRQAIDDGYQRLIAPSLENELRRELKERADAEAIGVFCANLRELLLAAPLGATRVLALDPGFRTGAKLVCLDRQGGLLQATTIYPTQSPQHQARAAETVMQLVKEHDIEAVAIGSGTAGRETETFIRSLPLPPEIIVTMVNEDGASVYSASEVARREFPDHDLTVRGAVSIGRRLQDPLAELVKIDPKAIGVGQYQHDVNQAALKRGLDDVVMSCVNSVGVELNTASLELLTYVAGLGPVLAANIISHRRQYGPFESRRDLLKVERLGPKAFEQCAGFLRVGGSRNPLDRSAVHPERYPMVTRMADDAGVSVQELIDSPTARAAIRLVDYVDDTVGLMTLEDIMAELARPGRDPRPAFTAFRFAEGITTIDDLKPGMRLPAIITNVTTFGAFADIGVHQDGLIHVSQLADHFVKNPAEVVKPRQQVVVRVLEVDAARRRIALSLKHQPSS